MFVLLNKSHVPRGHEIIPLKIGFLPGSLPLFTGYFVLSKQYYFQLFQFSNVFSSKLIYFHRQARFLFRQQSGTTAKLRDEACRRGGVHLYCHIFQKARVTSNKNAHNLQHHFGAQYFILYHMVGFVLFGVSS